MADISVDEILDLIDQLSSAEQAALIDHLQDRVQHRALSVQEKMNRLRAAQIDAAVNEEPSVRREDWYDDNGR